MPSNACLLTYISCFGQDINRLPCYYCLLIALFRIVCLIIQGNFWLGHCLSTILISPGSDSRDVTMAKIMVRAFPIGSIAKFTSPPARLILDSQEIYTAEYGYGGRARASKSKWRLGTSDSPAEKTGRKNR